MEQMERNEALDEAAFASMETVVLLMGAADYSDGDYCLEHLELLRQALGSARATVVAAGYVLTTFEDATRMRTKPSARTIG
jgi:hypothetical protein